MDFSSLPKVELHLHLDCSLSFEVVQKLDPTVSYDTFQNDFMVPHNCSDLADFLKRAIRSIELMQTKEALQLVTLDLFQQLKKDQVIYAEIRFAPLEHLQKGLNPKEVVQVVEESIRQGIHETKVEANIILCTLRHYSEAQSMETIQLVDQFKGSHVVGFDIAADEAGFPITNHIKAFEYAHSKGIPCTAHAGEAKGPESVKETLKHFNPKRIGHGVRSIEDPALIEFLKNQDIHLEVCPTSNLLTNIYEKMENHVANDLYQEGVSMSINTDGRTLSNITLNKEYQNLNKHFNWEEAHFLKCNLEAIRHAFLSPDKKRILKERLIRGFGLSNNFKK